MTDEDGNLWVFGYGSLMWRPGFDFAERRSARIDGWHRSLCIYSHVHRGTPEVPGLVLGLDSGGSCDGVAFRVEPPQIEATLAYLRARELVTNVYREARLDALLDDGRQVPALGYVVEQHHAQYAGRPSRAELLRLVRQGHGQSGANVDYVLSTHEHLVELGIRDETLLWLATRLQGGD